MPEASREPSAARTIADAAVEVSARGARVVGFAAGAVGFAARVSSKPIRVGAIEIVGRTI